MRLNDLRLANDLSTVHNEARRINELTAQGKALALAECLTKIEAAARDAQWRLLRMADEQGVEV
jgi:hypothetical protein